MKRCSVSFTRLSLNSVLELMNKTNLIKISAAILGLIFIISSPICLFYLWIITPRYGGFYGRIIYIYIFPILILINGVLFLLRHRFIPYAIFTNLLFCLSFIAQEKFITLYYFILFWNDQGYSVTGILKNSLFHCLNIYQHLLFIPSIFLVLVLLAFKPSRVSKLRI